MKKADPEKKGEMRSEYSRSDFPAGFVRGKYAARIERGSNIVVLSPEVSAVFPTAELVNEALRSLIRVAKTVTRKKPVSPARRDKVGARPAKRSQ